MKEITIAGQKFQIKIVTKETVREKGESSSYTYGVCDTDNRIIYLNRETKGELRKRVLIHEMIHAYLRMSSMDQFMKCHVEEAVCVVLENLLDAFNNLKLIEYLNNKKPEEME